MSAEKADLDTLDSLTAERRELRAALRKTCDCGGPEVGGWRTFEPSGHADWCVVVKALGGQDAARAALSEGGSK